jgi:hypothetical protein
MTHITIERAKLEQILEALESQHRDRLNYILAKRSANATCAEFKVNTLSELIESGYMHGIGKQTESAITVAKQALAAAPVQPVAQSMIKALTHAVEIAEAKRSGTWDDLLQYRVLLNTPPAQRQWVGLTDDDVYLLAHPRLARAIETKLKEKNT